MPDASHIDALLDLIDPDRTADPDESAQLVVLGLAEKLGRNACRPTTAGWNLLAERGRPFRTQF
ncbi:MAG: hypothetical protein ACI8U3_002582 [Brevundimonas sp.]|jgi:hypothetical protein|uniref:hypothetical protein n=1 Tax=Brevundimonas sp. TaxID=1871086 RepID=UPI0039E26BF5